MFTGIVTDVGEVRHLEKLGDLRAVIGTRYQTKEIDFGASISCNGVCLTVVDKGQDWFAVDISKESLERTTLGSWTIGSKMNLERSMRVGDELGGHIVSGHIDGVAEVSALRDEGDSRRLEIKVSRNLNKFIAEKGSIALDGISLTVNKVRQSGFGVNIIPHTWEKTTFKFVHVGVKMNLEIDTIARYIARMLDKSETQ